MRGLDGADDHRRAVVRVRVRVGLGLDGAPECWKTAPTCIYTGAAACMHACMHVHVCMSDSIYLHTGVAA